MKIKALFFTANIFFITAAAWYILPGRIFELQIQRNMYNIYERRLQAMEENYLRKLENTELLKYLQYHNEYIIPPPGRIGAVLADIRQILFSHNLNEDDFFASEQAAHYVNGHKITEIRTAISASGDYNDITAFIKSLTQHRRYLRLNNIHITKESDYAHLRLSLTIYEESAY